MYTPSNLWRFNHDIGRTLVEHSAHTYTAHRTQPTTDIPGSACVTLFSRPVRAQAIDASKTHGKTACDERWSMLTIAVGLGVKGPDHVKMWCDLLCVCMWCVCVPLDCGVGAGQLEGRVSMAPPPLLARACTAWGCVQTGSEVRDPLNRRMAAAYAPTDSRCWPLLPPLLPEIHA